ncbi:MAG: glutamate racemase [Chitinophagaceae bacterium]|nr:MAG: glutamate racemase [Chitinophagaceae bacterium]
MKSTSPIGVFDSGYGGLTVLKEITSQLPQYDYLYMGDNARAPYGPRSFEQVYQYTLQAVKWFFDQGCPLVILACNTASAKALRTIQQNDLEKLDPAKRLLGVIRPTAEVIGNYSTTGHVGVLGTRGTITSESYVLEIEKFFPEIKVSQEACPMWVPLIESNEHGKPGADYFVKQHIHNLMAKDTEIDTILLGCTHYPLLMKKLNWFVPTGVRVVEQGKIVASSLVNYLQRHPEMAEKCSKSAGIEFYTTGEQGDFDEHAANFFGQPVKSKRLIL